MATQQAAARAATVKSAQEMASARAAEISKQLKGNDPDVEEEKKSPVRYNSEPFSLHLCALQIEATKEGQVTLFSD